MQQLLLKIFLKASLLGFLTVSASQNAIADSENIQKRANTLPDLSGLSWIEEDLFLGVHDAKNTSEQPRISFIRLPSTNEGVLWQPIDLNWSDSLGAASDLESIARIPDTPLFLLVESGGGLAGDFRRIFLAEYKQQQLKIIDVIKWSTEVANVEGTSVAKVGDSLIFIYAERAEGKSQTKIRWSILEMNPLRLGTFQEKTFSSPDPTGINVRHITAMEVDKEGRLYIASAVDPNNNNGPFRSVIWQIATIQTDQNFKVNVVLETYPKSIAILDGLKVESIAIREIKDNKLEIFVGTDDENYGGTLRQLSQD